MVTVEQRTNDGIPILDVTGRLSAGEAADYLVSRVRAAIEGGRNRIVINLSGVGYIDSLGLEALLQIHNLLRGRKGEVKLLKPGDMYIIPGNVEHYAKARSTKAVALDIFSPVREEFQY